MNEDQRDISTYFALRRRAIAIIDSVSQTTCRYCADPCCERRLCMKAFQTFQPLIDMEPKVAAIRQAAQDTPVYRSFIDSEGCLFKVLRPTVCLAYYCTAGLSNLLLSQQFCILALGRAFPDAQDPKSADLHFLEYAVQLCEGVVRDAKPLVEKDRRRLGARIPGLSERMKLYVMRRP